MNLKHARIMVDQLIQKTKILKKIKETNNQIGIIEEVSIYKDKDITNHKTP
jgi:hypothetical protein